MKKIIVTCALLTCATLGVIAQTAKKPVAPPPPGQPIPNGPLTRPVNSTTPEQRAQAMAENQAKAFERQYGLNAEQYKGVYAACLEFANKMNSLHATNRQLTTQDFENIMNEKDAKFKKIMTAQQYAKYESTRTRPVPQPGSATKK